MQSEEELIQMFGSKYEKPVEVSQDHTNQVLEAVIVAAALNHRWYSKGKTSIHKFDIECFFLNV